MFWQHSGEGISSRRAEYCLRAFIDGRLGAKNIVGFLPFELEDPATLHKGPKRYQKNAQADGVAPPLDSFNSLSKVPDGKDYTQFVEERFGRNLDIALASSAKLAIRKRIADALSIFGGGHPSSLQRSCCQGPPAANSECSEDDVYLYPCGMNSIFHIHQLMMTCRGHMRSITYGYGVDLICCDARNTDML